MVQKVTTNRFQKIYVSFAFWPPLSASNLYVRKCHVLGSALREITSGEEQQRVFFCVLVLTSLMPRRTDIPLRFSANISTRDATTMTRSKIFQPLSKYLQKKTDCQTFLMYYNFIILQFLWGNISRQQNFPLWINCDTQCFHDFFVLIWFWFNASAAAHKARTC